MAVAVAVWLWLCSCTYFLYRRACRRAARSLSSSSVSGRPGELPTLRLFGDPANPTSCMANSRCLRSASSRWSARLSSSSTETFAGLPSVVVTTTDMPRGTLPPERADRLDRAVRGAAPSAGLLMLLLPATITDGFGTSAPSAGFVTRCR